jgi:outer membrane protein
MALGFAKSVKAGVAALALMAAAPVQVAAETLGEALVSAYNHSGLLQQNRALLRAADEDVAATFALLRPVINWTGSFGRRYGNSASSQTGGFSRVSAATEVELGLNFSLLLYDGGATQAAVEASKQTVLATRQQLVSVEQNVLLQAVQAYMNVVRDAQIVELRRNNLRLVSRELQAAKDRFEVGEVTRTDVALAEARLAGGRAELAVAQGNLMQSKEQYAAAVGHAPGALVAPRGAPSTPARSEEAKQIAVRGHPDLRAVQHNIKAAEFGVQRAEAALKPTVRLNSGVTLPQDLGHSNFYSNGGSVSLGLEAPIYQGGRLSALIRQAMANRDAQKGNLHVVRHSVRENAGVAWATLAAAGAQLEASGRQIEASRIAFDGVREEAKLGSRTTLDVLIAEQDLLDAESNRITAQPGKITAAYSLLASMGLLTADHLNLKVEQYDPEAYYNMVKDAPAMKSKRGKQLDNVLRALGKE